MVTESAGLSTHEIMHSINIVNGLKIFRHVFVLAFVVEERSGLSLWREGGRWFAAFPLHLVRTALLWRFSYFHTKVPDFQSARKGSGTSFLLLV